MKKIFFVFIIIFLAGGCGVINKQTGDVQSIANSSTSAFTANQCQPAGVKIEGYGDMGQRLTNCFVEYPGEPTREDKSYYIIEDLCGQFTKEFMENKIGRKMFNVLPSEIAGKTSCLYYITDTDYLLLALDYGSAVQEKKSLALKMETAETDALIAMDNFYSIGTDSAIKTVYFVLQPEKYLHLEFSSSKLFNNQQILELFENIAEEIKDYK